MATRKARPASPPDPQPDLLPDPREILARLGQLTGGLSPHAFADAWLEVLGQLARSPQRQEQLTEDLRQRALAFAQFLGQATRGEPAVPQAAGTPYAKRYDDAAWQAWPFNVLAQGFLTTVMGAREAMRNMPGASAAASNIVDFSLREGFELLAPDNYLPTNPQLLEQTLREQGGNLVRGAQHLAEDLQRARAGLGPVGTENYRPGERVATARGKVILRTRLMELIQYAPTTNRVYAEPVLIVPAWIMKYYILDLSPENSLVRYLTDQGHTVFMISWKNPTAADRDLSMDDYLRDGIHAALDAVNRVLPRRKVHALGYCIGGTLLAIALAALAGNDDHRLATATLLAAQTDFTEPGELSLFISEPQLAMLQAMMWQNGVLESRQMAGAFQLLRSHDLLWAPAVTAYLKGERVPVNDLMAWNADGTRMASRMHSQYLRQLYLDNDLAAGRYRAMGHRIRLTDVRLPMFVVGTETDHVAPWQSVYKAGRLVRSTDYTFCLTSGGHNAGIVSGPRHPRRHHRVLRLRSGARQLSPQRYLAQAPLQQGSWWPTFAAWLAAHSSARKVAAPTMGAARRGLQPLCDAPGTYVFER